MGRRYLARLPTQETIIDDHAAIAKTICKVPGGGSANRVDGEPHRFVADSGTNSRTEILSVDQNEISWCLFGVRAVNG